MKVNLACFFLSVVTRNLKIIHVAHMILLLVRDALCDIILQ